MQPRPLLIAAAAFNGAVGLPILLAPALVYGLAGMDAPAGLLEPRMVGVFVLLFAAAYLIVARDPRGNLPLLALSIAGKIAAFVTIGVHWLLGETATLFLLLGTLDLGWGVAFLILYGRLTAAPGPADAHP